MTDQERNEIATAAKIEVLQKMVPIFCHGMDRCEGGKNPLGHYCNATPLRAEIDRLIRGEVK